MNTTEQCETMLNKLQNEINLVEKQLEFLRPSTDDLIKNLFAHFQKHTNSDIWLNQTATNASDDLFKSAKCCSIS